jgi:hypothetical protein
MTPAIGADTDYSAKMIACEVKDEIFVLDAYDAFLELLTKRELKKEALRFPEKLMSRTESHVIFSRAYYISTNILAGFELSVPKECMSKKHGVLTSNTELVIAQDYTKQGIRVIILKKKEPAWQVEPARMAAGCPERP